jgi:hypothetical protein
MHRRRMRESVNRVRNGSSCGQKHQSDGRGGDYPSPRHPMAGQAVWGERLDMKGVKSHRADL